MSDLGRLLELLYGAWDSFETLEAEFRMWTDTNVQQQAARARQPEPPEGVVQTQHVSLQGDAPVVHEMEFKLSAAIERPEKARIESTAAVHGQTQLQVANGRDYFHELAGVSRQLTRNSPSAFMSATNQIAYLLCPVEMLAAREFSDIEKTSFAGRDALSCTATDREVFFYVHSPHGLDRAADARKLTIDAERGIVLRSDSTFEGTPLHVTEATDIAFDVPIPPERFEIPAEL